MEPRRWKQLKLATAGGGTACLSRERAVIQTSFSLFERGDMVQIDSLLILSWHGDDIEMDDLPPGSLLVSESMEEEFDVMADVLYE